MPIAFRPAQPQDFDYCARLYFEDLARFIQDPAEMAAKKDSFLPRWHVDQVRIITRGGLDIGWLQSIGQDDAVFIVQFFIEAALRGEGIGTEVLTRIIAEAAAQDRPVTLGVVKNNRALDLYRRFGFQITHEDDRKYYMRRPISS